MSIASLIASSPSATRFLMSHTPPDLLRKREAPFAKRALKTAIERTIAYPAFLIESGFDPSEASWENFAELPFTTKKSYLDRYSLRERCLDGDLHRMYVVERSSGVGGGCYYWPRLPEQDRGLVPQVDMGFRMFYGIDRTPTLLVSAFALGTWVGGVKMATILRQLAVTGKYPITVISPGVNIEEILQIVRDLSPEYEQTIVFGYPPFLKSVVDEGEARGMHWPDYHVRLGTTGEGFPEEWRESMVTRLGMDADRDLLGIMGGYGAADLGTSVAQEYPLTVLVRRLCMHDPALARDFFGQETVPNLFQYDPGSAYVECVDGELTFSVVAAVPLVRYAIHDLGGLVPFTHAAEILADNGYDVRALMRERGFGDGDIWPLPFLYCYGRADGTVNVGGANLYPENVEAVLAEAGDHDIRGFKLAVRDERLVILLEHHDVRLATNGLTTLSKRYHDLLVEGLPKVNSEYRSALAADRRVADPVVEVHPAGGGPFAEDVGRLKRRYTVEEHPAAA